MREYAFGMIHTGLAQPLSSLVVFVFSGGGLRAGAGAPHGGQLREGAEGRFWPSFKHAVKVDPPAKLQRSFGSKSPSTLRVSATCNLKRTKGDWRDWDDSPATAICLCSPSTRMYDSM